jgi:TonB family protein
MMKTFGRKWKLRHFFFVSLAVHALCVLTLAISYFFDQQKPIMQTVQLEIFDPAAAPENKEALDKKIKDNEQRSKNQVVEQDEKALNEETPDDARFLGRHNQVVKKQTVAQARGEFQNKQSKEIKYGAEGEAKSASKGLDLKPSFNIVKSVQDRAAKEAAYEKAAEDGTFPLQQQVENAKKQEDSRHAASKGADVSQSLDYIKDLDSGLETLLSTKEFVYYSYFNRIRAQLNQYWSDKVRQKLSEMYKKGRMIASSDDKVTRCLITLDQSGRLIKIQIIGDSGIRELDEAAVEAFRSAAPFPNPPKGMMDEDGNIKIRWDFILEA